MLELTPPLTALPRSRIEGQMDVAARHLWPKAPVMLGMCGEEPRVRLMSMPRLRAPSLRGGGVRMGGRSRDYSSELSGADGAGGVKGNAGECKELAGGGHDSSCEGSDSARGFVVVLGYP